MRYSQYVLYLDRCRSRPLRAGRLGGLTGVRKHPSAAAIHSWKASYCSISRHALGTATCPDDALFVSVMTKRKILPRQYICHSRLTEEVSRLVAPIRAFPGGPGMLPPLHHGSWQVDLKLVRDMH